MIKSLLSRKLGELRVTRTDLSRATGIRLNTISALYNDALDRVSMDQLDKICEALDCDLSEILVWEPNKIKMTSPMKKGK
ncbi:MAG: helix-turn-helix transcriptional regulator [Negativibacillus massiliensis]|nr:helix-turn-helix transcriptional regulator [Negativibacillus massiliensis]